eukprot:3765214-Pleurochrysis_carterae.AAC.2
MQRLAPRLARRDRLQIDKSAGSYAGERTSCCSEGPSRMSRMQHDLAYECSDVKVLSDLHCRSWESGSRTLGMACCLR